MKKLICLVGAVIMAVSLFLVPCGAVSSSSPAWTGETGIAFYTGQGITDLSYVTTYALNYDSTRMSSYEYIFQQLSPSNLGLSSRYIRIAPNATIISFDVDENYDSSQNYLGGDIGSLLFQGTFIMQESNGIEADNYFIARNGTGSVQIDYLDGTSETITLESGTNFYITVPTDWDYIATPPVTFYISIDSITKPVDGIYINLNEHPSGYLQYFLTGLDWAVVPSDITVGWRSFILTFGESSGGGETGGGESGGETEGDTTSTQILNAIIGMNEQSIANATAISDAIFNLGVKLTEVDAETATKMLEAEAKRETINGQLEDIENDTSQFFTDLTNRFQELGLDGFEFPAAIISGFQLMGNLFTQIWNAMDDYKVVYLFPLMLSVALVIIGRISRSGKRNGSGATNNADRKGEVKDA